MKWRQIDRKNERERERERVYVCVWKEKCLQSNSILGAATTHCAHLYSSKVFNFVTFCRILIPNGTANKSNCRFVRKMCQNVEIVATFSFYIVFPSFYWLMLCVRVHCSLFTVHPLSVLLLMSLVHCLGEHGILQSKSKHKFDNRERKRKTRSVANR